MPVRRFHALPFRLEHAKTFVLDVHSHGERRKNKESKTERAIMLSSLGNMIQRYSERGPFYEARAEELCGNQGGPCPMVTPDSWAKSVTVHTENYWMVAGGDGGEKVYGDGTGPGTNGLPTEAGGLVAPALKKGALIARWCWTAGCDIHYISDWFYVGIGGTFEVPIPGAITPTPGPVGFDCFNNSPLHNFDCFNYKPRVSLMYRCNDDDFSDNAGSLHVYETYNP